MFRENRLQATIQNDGRVVFEGEPYDSLSTAAAIARRTVIGSPLGRKYPQTNGWTFWQCRDAGTGSLQEIDVLRQRYLSRDTQDRADRRSAGKLLAEMSIDTIGHRDNSSKPASLMSATGIPTYRVRVSTRAKRVRLEVSAQCGLVVVVPKGFDETNIPALVERKRAWIEKALERLKQRQDAMEPDLPALMPERILLRAIGEEWTIQKQPEQAPWVAAKENGHGTLLVHGCVGDTAACATVLRRWINWKAHHILVPWLSRVSEEEGLPFGRTMVRSQRTRWGSCSSHKTISINQNLLFVLPDLVRYVFIHELCHTLHPNHSRRFWELVAKKEPNYLALRRELRRADHWIPGCCQWP